MLCTTYIYIHMYRDEESWSKNNLKRVSFSLYLSLGAIYNGKEAGVGPRVQKALIFHYILCTRTCRGHTMLASPTPDAHHRTFATPESPSPRLIIFQRHPLFACAHVRLHANTVYHCRYHYNLTTTIITVCMYTTTTNVCVYNICEGIVKKKVEWVREREREKKETRWFGFVNKKLFSICARLLFIYFFLLFAGSFYFFPTFFPTTPPVTTLVILYTHTHKRIRRALKETERYVHTYIVYIDCACAWLCM